MCPPGIAAPHQAGDGLPSSSTSLLHLTDADDAIGMLEEKALSSGDGGGGGEEWLVLLLLLPLPLQSKTPPS